VVAYDGVSPLLGPWQSFQKVGSSCLAFVSIRVGSEVFLALVFGLHPAMPT